MTGAEHGGAPPTSLLEKLRSVVSADYGPIEGADAYPDMRWTDAGSRGAVAEFVSGVKDWGIVYGVAFGIARAECPFDSAEHVGERAYEAAREFFDEFNGGLLIAPWACEEVGA